jgi:hypothetical protein
MYLKMYVIIQLTRSHSLSLLLDQENSALLRKCSAPKRQVHAKILRIFH